MERRGFLKRFFGTAVAVATVAAAPEYCHSLCSSWCTEHATPPRETLSSYADYSNFSEVARTAYIDEEVSKMAEELGRNASKSIADFSAMVFDTEHTVVFGRS